MPTQKKSPGQGRDFYVAELYQAAMELDISDGAHRVLCALIRRINTDSASKAYETTFVGQEWIAMHIGKDVRGVRRFVAELVGAGLIQVAQSGRNDTNLTRVDIDALLRLGRAHSVDVDAKLEKLRNERKADKEEDLRSKLDKSGRIKSPSRDRQESPGQGRSKAPSDLISVSNQKITTSTVATPSATQPSEATRRAGGSRAHGSSTTKPQSPRGFDDATIVSWESLEVKILSKLEQLRIDGLTTSERINKIHQSLMVKRYTIGSELLTAYERGLAEAHEAQIASEWIMKVALAPASVPSRHIATLRAFVRGKADMFTASAESRITKQRRANAS